MATSYATAGCAAAITLSKGRQFRGAVKMKALSLKQPMAWGVIHGGKDIENRKWKNKHAHGTIAIHASNQFGNEFVFPRGVKKPPEEEMVQGAIIGLVDIVDVVKRHRSKWFTGPYGFVLANPRPLPNPIPFKGKLGFWEVPPSIVKEIKSQLGIRERPQIG